MKTKEKSFQQKLQDQAALLALIAKKNKKFNDATAAQRRVMIAQDAKERIITGQFTPEEGSWATVEDENSRSEMETVLFLNQPEAKCQVCGLGALWVSAICHRNNATLDSYELEDPETGESCPLDGDGILPEFDREQRELIETAFEQGNGAINGDNADADAMAFGEKYDDPKTRLLAILDNIIKNKGTFKP